jgi:hypothetical protein
MKKPPYLILVGLSLLFLSGCANSSFMAYSGAQQNWPTAAGGFVDTSGAVPAYFGLPHRPYTILGYLDATTAPVRRAGVVKYAAAKAKELGGDAIIVVEQGSEYRGSFQSGSAYTDGTYTANRMGNTVYGDINTKTSYSGSSIPMYAGKSTVIVIRYK